MKKVKKVVFYCSSVKLKSAALFHNIHLLVQLGILNIKVQDYEPLALVGTIKHTVDPITRFTLGMEAIIVRKGKPERERRVVS